MRNSIADWLQIHFSQSIINRSQSAISRSDMKNIINKSSVSYMQTEVWDNLKEYTETFKEVIRQREKIQIPFLHTSPQLAYRAGIVNYLRKICTEKKFSHCCLHLAVYLLDVFMDCHNVIPDKILLLANVCLLLAAKFEENICNVPKISELNAIVQQRYVTKEYRDLEVMILDYFCWYIRFPTVAHYTHYYMQVVVTNEELAGQSEGLRTVIYKIHNYVLEYLDQVIDNVHYMQDFKPSKLAAAIIAASRSQCGLHMWSENLQELTDYSKDDIQGVLYTLQINKYSQQIEPMLPYSHFVCTFRENYCESCSIKSCPKCFFLKKV